MQLGSVLCRYGDGNIRSLSGLQHRTLRQGNLGLAVLCIGGLCIVVGLSLGVIVALLIKRRR